MRLFICALFAICLSGCPNNAPAPVSDATVSDADVSEVACETEWVEAFSGRFYMKPKSAWLESGLESVHHEQVHWWLEIEAISGDSAVCDTHPRKRGEGAGTCLGDQVGPVKVLQSTRTLILKEMVNLGLLPTEGLLYSVMPDEFYNEREFARMVERNTIKHFGNENVEFCRVKLTIQMLKLQTSTGKWWDEEIYIFPEESGGCCD